jgi:hypothetical protein
VAIPHNPIFAGAQGGVEGCGPHEKPIANGSGGPGAAAHEPG